MNARGAFVLAKNSRSRSGIEADAASPRRFSPVAFAGAGTRTKGLAKRRGSWGAALSLCIRVCVCVCARARACVRVSVCVCVGWVGERRERERERGTKRRLQWRLCKS
jgi:hypothetical protein